MEKIVLANFSATRSLVYGTIGVVVISGIMGIVARSAVMLMFGRAGYWQSHLGYWLFLSGNIWLFGSVLLLFFAALFRQVIVRKGIAVWVEGDRLVYLDKRYFAVHLNDITWFGIGSSGRFNIPGVILALRNGEKKSIPLRLLREPVQVILQRLHAANPSIDAAQQAV